MPMNDETLEAETRGILAAMPHVLVRKDGLGWLVGCGFNGIEQAGHTSISDQTSEDPRDLARRLLAQAFPPEPQPAPIVEPEPTPDPAPSGVFDSEPIEPEQVDVIPDDESFIYEGSPLEADEPAADDPGGDVGPQADAGDPDDADPGDVAAELSLADHGGVLISGDPLKAAQMEATWAVGDREEELVSQYASDENLARLNEMRGIALAIKEGVHPAFSTEEAEELQALETFASWLSSVRSNADRLRNAIRVADTIEAVQAVSLDSGWPD